MDQRTLPEGFYAKEAVDLILGAFVLETQRDPRQAEEDLGYLDSLLEPEFAAAALINDYPTQTILSLLVELSERPLETLLGSQEKAYWRLWQWRSSFSCRIPRWNRNCGLARTGARAHQRTKP